MTARFARLRALWSTRRSFTCLTGESFTVWPGRWL